MFTYMIRYIAEGRTYEPEFSAQDDEMANEKFAAEKERLGKKGTNFELFRKVA